MVSTTVLGDSEYWQEVHEGLRKKIDDERDAVVFLHGFNVKFREAALRAAQLGVDLGISGLMAFFSWPSVGSKRHYAADAAAIESSELVIEEFLVSVARRSGARRVHVIAHSMGNRALLRAVNRIAQNAGAAAGKPFTQIVVAAADVDRGTFVGLSAAFGAVAERTTLYVSPSDRALGLSSFLHQYPRAGFTPPVVVVPGVDTVDVQHLDLSVFGHGYLAEAKELLFDLHTLFRHGTSPSRRFGMRPRTTADGSAYWEFAP